MELFSAFASASASGITANYLSARMNIPAIIACRAGIRTGCRWFHLSPLCLSALISGLGIEKDALSINISLLWSFSLPLPLPLPQELLPTTSCRWFHLYPLCLSALNSGVGNRGGCLNSINMSLLWSFVILYNRGAG
jgi:hypothetical protein